MIVFCMARQNYGSFLEQWVVVPYVAIAVWSNYCTDAALLATVMQALAAVRHHRLVALRRR